MFQIRIRLESKLNTKFKIRIPIVFIFLIQIRLESKVNTKFQNQIQILTEFKKKKPDKEHKYV